MRHKKEKATPQISRESHRFHPSQISSRTALFTTKRRQIRLICQPVRPFVRTNDRTHRQNDFRKRQATALLTACSPLCIPIFQGGSPTLSASPHNALRKTFPRFAENNIEYSALFLHKYRIFPENIPSNKHNHTFRPSYPLRICFFRKRSRKHFSS